MNAQLTLSFSFIDKNGQPCKSMAI